MMPKEEKKTYHAEAVAPNALRLEPHPARRGKPSQSKNDAIPRREFFTQELIRRLAERIKDL